MTERKQTNRKLELELKRLKSVLDMAHELRLEWFPGQVKRFRGRRLSGEVLGEVIHIYDESEPRALTTLKHEFIEYILTIEFTAPYKRMINTLISAFEEEMYQRKERVVKRLSDVI
ncbi:unnamed protein product [marine sediment metagenome]|uniref:Uncharacterized protein n=1 Tax=marine sediment metagenome TaxID=412755 RepID=X1P6L8_9ZZZZ